MRNRRLDAVESRLGELSSPRFFFDLVKHAEGHPRQLEFMRGVGKFRTASCSRRAGKTEGCVGVLIDSALKKAGSTSLYLTKTRLNAKRIIWRPLKRALRAQGIACDINEADLAVIFPNGSTIYLAGADQRDEIEKYRGNGFGVVIIDEAQMIHGYLKELVDEVLAAALMDYDGFVVLVGTPSPVPSGYYYECTQSPEWEHFNWTVFDNPWILAKSGKTPQQHLDAELKRRGITVDDPIIQREYFGRWVYDPNSLVFRYDAGRNHYNALPSFTDGEWNTVVCGDLGFDDSDALAVLRWNSTRPFLWLVHEDVCPKQTITQLGDKLKKLVDTHKPLATVLDTGGLGKKIAEELSTRWGLQIEAADKERKLEHIELLNDALRSGRLFSKKESRFAQDCMLVEWDKKNPEKPKISDRYHSDVCDAVLYGYRRCLQWLAPMESETEGPQTEAETRARTEAALREANERRHRPQSNDLFPQGAFPGGDWGDPSGWGGGFPTW